MPLGTGRQARLAYLSKIDVGKKRSMGVMFPGYLFTKFVYSKQHRAVEASHGVRGIVRFGDRLATLPEVLSPGFSRQSVQKKS
jgi:transcription antitermination factor NusG